MTPKRKKFNFMEALSVLLKSAPQTTLQLESAFKQVLIVANESKEELSREELSKQLTLLAHWAETLDNAQLNYKTPNQERVRDFLLELLKININNLPLINQAFTICFKICDLQRCRHIFNQVKSNKTHCTSKMPHKIQFQLNVGRMFLYFRDFPNVFRRA
jgi:hypothetical protein